MVGEEAIFQLIGFGLRKILTEWEIHIFFNYKRLVISCSLCLEFIYTYKEGFSGSEVVFVLFMVSLS